MGHQASSKWDIAIINSLILASNAGGRGTSNLRLQKLAYFTHGVYSASSEAGAPLIEEPFQAWPYGPVLVSIYHAFKAHGSQSISFLLTDDDSQAYKVPHGSVLCPYISSITNWAADKGDIDLVRISHQQASPWYQAYYDDETARGALIDQSTIASYFQSFMRDHNLQV